MSESKSVFIKLTTRVNAPQKRVWEACQEDSWKEVADKAYRNKNVRDDLKVEKIKHKVSKTSETLDVKLKVPNMPIKTSRQVLATPPNKIVYKSTTKFPSLHRTMKQTTTHIFTTLSSSQTLWQQECEIQPEGFEFTEDMQQIFKKHARNVMRKTKRLAEKK